MNKKYLINDICDVGSSKRIYLSEYKEKGVPFYRGKEIIEKDSNKDISNELFISQERYDEIKEKFGAPKVGDILMTAVGTIGVSWYVNESNFYFKDGNLIWFKNFKNDIVNSKFLYYVFKSKIFNEMIKNISIGSTQKAITIEQVKKIALNLPNIIIQNKIVKILENIDKKIKVNNEINNNLHELLKKEYNEKFIIGKKDSWLEDKLGNYLSIDRGLSYKGQFLSNAGVPMINLGNVMPNGVFRIEKNKYYSGEYKDKVVTKVGDIVIANTDMTQNRDVIGTPVIIPPIYNDKIIFSHHIYCLRDLKLPKMYIFYTLLTDHWNAAAGGNATGTTVLALPKETIENYNIIIPDKDTLELFDNIASNIQNKREQILLENIKLEQLRDTLLPKLMSGEINLDNIEI